jgi:alpha-D-xyloside xylohydrolase
MMRGLMMDFNGDREIYDIKDHWMFGPALMACPVGYYKARNRTVYFPKQSGWYDLYSGEHIAGGQRLVVDAPYERIPVFVREGSIIPYGPEMQYSDERPAADITLYVYAGSNGSFQLYEDEGTNYNYEKGKYATIDITYDDAAKTLTFGKRQGSFNGMLKERRFHIVYVTADKPRALDYEPQDVPVVSYKGNQMVVTL